MTWKKIVTGSRLETMIENPVNNSQNILKKPQNMWVSGIALKIRTDFLISFQRPQMLDLTGFRPFQILFLCPQEFFIFCITGYACSCIPVGTDCLRQSRGSRIPLSLPMMYNCFSNIFSKLNSYGTKVRILKNRDMWRCQK